MRRLDKDLHESRLAAMSAILRRLVQLSNLHVMLKSLGDGPLTHEKVALVQTQCDIAQVGVEVAYKNSMRKLVRRLRRWIEETELAFDSAAAGVSTSEETSLQELRLSVEEAQTLLDADLSASELKEILKEHLGETERSVEKRRAAVTGT